MTPSAGPRDGRPAVVWGIAGAAGCIIHMDMLADCDTLSRMDVTLP